MLLEDDENLNRGIALKLQKEGYQVFSAFQISEAEKLFDENRIDLVISDITLPDGNGLEFCRKIRNKSKAIQPDGTGFKSSGIYEKNGRSLRTQQNLIGKYRSKLWRNESVKTKC